MGWFVGISTRTPTTSIFLTAAPSSYAPDALPHAWALRWALPSQRTPVPAESAVAAGPGGPAAGGRNQLPASSGHAPDLAAAGPANPGSSYPAPPSLASACAA
jgi:hypothetical protein